MRRTPVVACAPMRTVTVVIPVHNNADLVCACIASCARHIHARHTILVMDDGSDPQESDRIRDCTRALRNVRFVRNTAAVGFVQTCNKAVLELDTTDNDVLLLNSDTIVTEGFLEEMLACLYASERHASCSPRSNNATICNVPLYRSRDYTAHESEACWQRLKDLLPRYTIVPTSVGFCMLLKRELIRRFGLFDKAYGHGYQEENDWCRRVNRMGFSAILSNRAFVFHAGAASFGRTRKQELTARNSGLLRRRYPEYEQAVREYGEHYLPAAEYFGEVLSAPQARPQILIDLSHLHAAYNGTSEYICTLLPLLAARTEDRWDLWILVPKRSDEFFGFSGRFARVVHTEDLPLPQKFDLSFTPQQLFTLDHAQLLNRLAVRIVITIHDVIALRCGQLHTSTHEWAMRTMLRYADGIVAISDSSLHDTQAYFRTIVENRPSLRTRTIRHGCMEPQTLSPHEFPPAPFSTPFVFVVGNRYSHKAVQDAVACLPTHIPAVILGGNYTRDKRGNRLFLQSGHLTQQHMQALYAQCAAVIFPSQYEGFGLPLLHAAAHGKYVITCDTDVNREIARTMDIATNLLLFRTFGEIPARIATALASPPPPAPPHTRTWDDVAAETDAFLAEILAAPPDMRVIDERFSTYIALENALPHALKNALPHAPKNTIFRRLRQSAASYAGRILAPYPRVKERLASIADAVGLLP